MAEQTRIDFIHVGEEEQRRLAQSAPKIEYPASGSYEPFIAASRQMIETALAPRTLDHIGAVDGHDPAAAVVVVSGLPFDASIRRGLCDPEVAHASNPDDRSEAILAGVVASFAEPYGISREGNGLVSHLSPRRDAMHAHTGLGSSLALDLHVENAAARLLPGDRAPDGLALIGLCDDPGGQAMTQVADARAALALLDADTRETLHREDAFLVRFPKRWAEAGLAPRMSAAIRSTPERPLSVVAAFYGGLMEGRSLAAGRALDLFAQALDAVAIDLAITPGSLALINNHVALHGRRAFTPRFDEDGLPYRYLQRLFWSSSLHRFGCWTRHRGRLIEPLQID